jgi:hypothetical protein
VASFAQQLNHPSFSVLCGSEDFIWSLSKSQLLFSRHSIPAPGTMLHCHVTSAPRDIEEKRPTRFGRAVDLKHGVAEVLRDAFN